MKDPALAIQEQIERRVAQVRYVRRRNDALACVKDPSAANGPQHGRYEIVTVPRAEEGAGANDQRLWRLMLELPFGFGFGVAIDSQGGGAIRLDIRRALRPSKTRYR